MTTVPDSRLEAHDSTIPSEEIIGNTSEATHRLLLFTLLLSAISSILAIVVAIRSRRETDASDKKKELTEQNIRREMQELRAEIVLLKNQQ